METERVRGNPPGITNKHVAANIRAARQAIGMDLQTLSRALGAAGRKLSTSGISKVENGDRRVDVDDLTAIAYVLRTTPAHLLTPPEEATTLTGVPEKTYTPEEIDGWMRGEIELSGEGLLNYWQQEWVVSMNRIRFLEGTVSTLTAGGSSKDGGPDPATVEAYTRQLADARAREQVIRERGVQIDPTGRVFSAADYLEHYGETHRPPKITARKTRS